MTKTFEVNEHSEKLTRTGACNEHDSALDGTGGLHRIPLVDYRDAVASILYSHTDDLSLISI